MTPQEQLELFSRYDEDELYTAALQLMWRIHDEVVYGDEEAVHGDLPAAIDDLCLGEWRELDRPLVAEWPYPVECTFLGYLIERLAEVASTRLGQEAALSASWLLGPGDHPLWASG